ncbi:hypothetical protein [Microvirga zambiensis]|uniref:hypothetical protein n=1 Tax=Microvirga zambiensis TaxID=1402137 RepID=UPI00191D2CD2|nr:hypothetical protein [Microvirga zambiensis]
MKKTFHALPILMAGLLAASGVNALTLDNGRNMNGRNMNGLAFNGTAGEQAAGRAAFVILADGTRVTLE